MNLTRNFICAGVVVMLCLMPAALMAEGGQAVSQDMLIFSGAIVDKVPGVGKISASPGGRNIMGQGDSVYIRTDIPAVQGAMFYVLDGPEKIIHPATHCFVGYLVRIKGIVVVAGEEGGDEKAVVVKSFKEINLNDLLGEYYPVAQVKLRGQKPAGIKGVIVGLTDEKIVAGGGNIVYLDKGAADGVAAGDLFDVASGEKPNFPAGVIQVIHVQSRTSTALIRKSRDAIRPGDSFGN
ncbi:MAG: hypothetical protein HQK96_15910 [Nitrospirae bacterium]|nr:hypothetical protein [Nitrospirota bacterium]MBF0556010.1 hypothetical protein [Nitrospirota bacterium]